MKNGESRTENGRERSLTNEAWLQGATEFLSSRQGWARPEAHTRARLLLDGATGTRFSHLMAPKAILEAAALEKLQGWLQRAATGEPIPYILARAPFWSREWEVGAGVLIPRSETELLIETISEIFPISNAGALRFADLGTGSGIIAATLALERPLWSGVATEISSLARAIAARNFARYGVETRLALLAGDEKSWFAPLENAGKFELLVSNPPYIARDEIENLQIEVRDFEPRLALDGGEDGLTPYRQIAARGSEFLVPNGVCALEIGWDQGQSVPQIFEENGWEVETVRRDLAGLSRVVVARAKAP